MIVKLLTEHYLEFLSLKEGCRGWSESTRQNATLLEITCHGSFILVKEIVLYEGNSPLEAPLTLGDTKTVPYQLFL